MTPLSYSRPLAVLVLASAGLIGCGPGAIASQLATPPDLDIAGQSKCAVGKSKNRPLVVEWPSADRGALEARVRKGLVAVRYEGCDMEVLRGCTVKDSAYEFVPITAKKDVVTIRNSDDLYANLPLGAVSLEAKLERSGELNVTMTMVGRFESARVDYRHDELTGSRCAQATHIVSAATVGAFKFFAGAAAEVGGGVKVFGAGAGAGSKSNQEILNQDGDEASCGADHEDGPPPGCGAMIRLEVTPLVGLPAPRNPKPGQPKPGQPKPGQQKPDRPTPDRPAPPPPSKPDGKPTTDLGLNLRGRVSIFNNSDDVVASIQWKKCGGPVSAFVPFRNSTIKMGGNLSLPVPVGTCLDLVAVSPNKETIAGKKGFRALPVGSSTWNF